MNTIEKMYQEADGKITVFSQRYFAYLGELLGSLDSEAIRSFFDLLEEARMSQKTIFIAGNGGSAATASHIGIDFGASAFNGHEEGILSKKSYRILPLTDNVAVISAIGNDFGYEHVFSKQLEMQYQEGDMLVVISASGNSPNLVRAAEWVKGQKGKVLGLLGFDGGKLKDLCDVAILAKTPKGEYGPVEDVHMILDHMFTAWMQQRFRQASAKGNEI